VDLIHGDRVLLYADGRVKQEAMRSFAPRLGEDKNFLLNNMVIKTSTVLFHRRLLLSMRTWFRGDLKTCEDYELFWRLVIAAQAVAYDTSDQVRIHVTPKSLTDVQRHLRLRDHIRARQSVLRWAEGPAIHADARRIMRMRLIEEVKDLFAHALKQGPLRFLAELSWVLRHVHQAYLWQEAARRLRRRTLAGATWIRAQRVRARQPRP
jgi:hypothetical protein